MAEGGCRLLLLVSSELRQFFQHILLHLVQVSHYLLARFVFLLELFERRIGAKLGTSRSKLDSSSPTRFSTLSHLRNAAFIST